MALLSGTVAGGIAAGAVFMGSLATANRLAPPGRRGQVISTYLGASFAAVIPLVCVAFQFRIRMLSGG